jgi:plastocyanin
MHIRLQRSLWFAAWMLSASASAAVIEVNVYDQGNKPLADAVVVLQRAGPAKSGNKPKRAVIEQIDREFNPFVSVVQTGTTVAFPNRDPLLHHLFSFSQAKTFEIKLYRGEAPRDLLFDEPGVVALGCNIHDWMEAYVLVVDSPYHAKTSSQGNALVINLPAGDYRLWFWHPHQKKPPPPQTLRVAQSDKRQLTTRFEIEKRPRRDKPPLQADNYAG